MEIFGYSKENIIAINKRLPKINSNAIYIKIRYVLDKPDYSLEDLEKTICDCFDELLCFDPMEFNDYLPSLILNSIKIPINDKLYLLKLFSDLGIEISKYSSSFDFIEVQIQLLNMEFLNKYYKIYPILPFHLIYTAFDRDDNIDMIDWLWDKAKLSKFQKRQCLEKSCFNANMKYVIHLVENKGLSVEDLSILKGSHIADNAVKSGNPEILKYLIQHGLIIVNDIRESLEGSITKNNLTMFSLIIDTYNPKKYNYKTRVMWRTFHLIKKDFNIELFKIFSKILKSSIEILRFYRSCLMVNWISALDYIFNFLICKYPINLECIILYRAIRDTYRRKKNKDIYTLYQGLKRMFPRIAEKVENMHTNNQHQHDTVNNHQNDSENENEDEPPIDGY